MRTTGKSEESGVIQIDVYPTGLKGVTILTRNDKERKVLEDAYEMILPFIVSMDRVLHKKCA